MSAHRLFVPSNNIEGDRITVSDPAKAHHLRDVLRIKTGEDVAVFDEKGREYIGQVVRVSPREIILKTITKHRVSGAGKKIYLAVAVAIPKKAKFSGIVDKLTQLGVDRIIPMVTERTIVRPDKRKAELLCGRWKKIAQGASEQSQRNDFPVIEPVKRMQEVIAESAQDSLKLIPAPAEKQQTLKKVLEKAGRRNILVVIGPEGDFSPRELKLAEDAGFIPVTLGKLVLRVDTAAVAAASYIMLNSV